MSGELWKLKQLTSWTMAHILWYQWHWSWFKQTHTHTETANPYGLWHTNSGINGIEADLSKHTHRVPLICVLQNYSWFLRCPKNFTCVNALQLATWMRWRSISKACHIAMLAFCTLCVYLYFSPSRWDGCIPQACQCLNTYLTLCKDQITCLFAVPEL